MSKHAKCIMIFTKTFIPIYFVYIYSLLSQDIQKTCGVLNAFFPIDPFAAMMTEEADNVEANCSRKTPSIRVANKNSVCSLWIDFKGRCYSNNI